MVRVDEPTYYVVIDYKDQGSHRYLAVQASDALGRKPHGPAMWLCSADFTPTGKTNLIPGRLFRKRKRLEMDDPDLTGCDCLCGPHWCGVDDGEPRQECEHGFDRRHYTLPENAKWCDGP